MPATGRFRDSWPLLLMLLEVFPRSSQQMTHYPRLHGRRWREVDIEVTSRGKAPKIASAPSCHLGARLYVTSIMEGWN